MAGIRHLVGTPWHKDFLARQEGDPRRHRIWCEHYSKESDYCNKRVMRCMGSAHCNYYKEKNIRVQQHHDTKSTFREIDAPKVFEGIKLIRMSDISLGSKKMSPPTQENIDFLMKYYDEYGEFDQPVLVSYCGSKYILNRRYARYYVAKQLGLKYIAARIGDTPTVEERISTKGCHIVHSQYGNGEVIGVTPTMIEVRFAKNMIKILDVEMCIKNNIIKPK